MEDKFNQLARLRANTISHTDRDKILDAMLSLGTYDQLARLRANTISHTDRDKILDAMLRVDDNSKVKSPSRVAYLPKRQYDVFIAHASEDKSFVTPLALSLRKRGVKVWYDDFVLKVGDSLRREIDKGLAQSRYGIVVLSHNFFSKNWPQKELDGLAAKEQIDEKVILPVWHNIDKEGVASYSPTLAGIVAVKSSIGIEAVTNKIIQAISS